jgi:hypothetical protein
MVIASAAEPIAALRVLLLDLLGGTVVASQRLAALRPGDWQRLGQLAADYRQAALLQVRHGDNPAIPAELRASWRAGYRQNALQAMVLKTELSEVVRLLESRGLAPIALKGAWLAWHAYPAPALRPMVDLDLLLTPDTVVAGYELLQAEGYLLPEPPDMAIADVLRLDKHMPALIAPRGTVIELHHRLWEPDASPAHDEAAVRARAIRLDGILYPAPEDMLSHLIIHAAYGHRLNCGPVILSDLKYLLERYPVDWACFWRRAAREGWRAGARLLFAGAARHGDVPDIMLTEDAGPPPTAAILASFADLILQDRNNLKNAAFLAAGLTGGAGALWQRLRGVRGTRDGASAARDMTHTGGFLGWAASRCRRLGGQVFDPELLRQSRDLARFSRWLDH